MPCVNGNAVARFMEFAAQTPTWVEGCFDLGVWDASKSGGSSGAGIPCFKTRSAEIARCWHYSRALRILPSALDCRMCCGSYLIVG